MSNDVRRLMQDPAFQAACETVEKQYKDGMALSVSEAGLHLNHRKLRVLYDVVETLAVAYETAVYDAQVAS